MNRKTTIYTLLLTATTMMQGHSAWAQQAWTLQQCLDHASEHNIQLKKSRISLLDAQEQLLQAKAALFPTLSAAVSQSVGYRPFQEAANIVQNGMATSTSNKVTENGSYGLNANWTVWNGGINRKNIKAQELQTELTEVQSEQNLNSIQEQIAQLYVQVLYTTEARKVNEKLRETAQQQLDRGKERYKLGDLAKADLAQLEAQLASADYDVVNAETQIATYKRQLKELLQLGITESFDVAQSEMDDSRALDPIPSKVDVYNAALNNRPEIRAAQLSADAADLQVDIAKRGYLPTVGVNAGFGTSHYAASGQDAFGEQMKRNLNGSVGVSVSVPIFDNRRNKTSVNRAKLQQTATALDLLDKQTTLGSNIENIWLQATSAQQRFQSAKAAVQSQETNYELVNEQFKAGLKNIVDLLQARDNLLQAQQNKLQSKYTTILNTQLLRFYEGGQLNI
ncbi:MAG: TolC family protein [Bacteroidaceae bacterium]|nr:TolC family protein [Bacteroidaceae bacterium]